MASSHIVFIGKIKPYLREIVLSQESAGQVYCKALGKKGILLNNVMVFHKWKQKQQTQQHIRDFILNFFIYLE